jgi:hypothetical protein
VPKHKGWRTADLLPIQKEWEEKNGRMSDTGEWDWDVPNAIRGMWDAIKLPGEVDRGEVNPMSEEGFERTMNLAGFGVSPLRFAPVKGTTLTSHHPYMKELANVDPNTPLFKELGLSKYEGSIGTLNQSTVPASTSTVPMTPKWGSERGFFMGPWANEQNLPGVTLASRPQKGRMVAHGTASPELFDVPRHSVVEDELGLHVSPDPSVFNVYTEPSYSMQAKPRSYPMVQATGGILSPHQTDMLPDLGPWGDSFMVRARWLDNLVDPDRQEEIFNDVARRMYPDADDPYEVANDAGRYGEMSAMVDDIMEQEAKDVIAGSLLEHQDIMSRLEKGEPTASIFGQWPAMDFQHGSGKASMVTDPGTALHALTPEGMLARRWNEIEPMLPVDEYFEADAIRRMRNMEITEELIKQGKIGRP